MVVPARDYLRHWRRSYAADRGTRPWLLVVGNALTCGFFLFYLSSRPGLTVEDLLGG